MFVLLCRFIDRAAEISSAAGVDGRVPGLFIYINCAFGLFQSRRSLIEKGIRSPLSTTLKDDFRQRKENTRTSESVSTSTVVELRVHQAQQWPSPPNGRLIGR